jgi:hypothetical protein
VSNSKVRISLVSPREADRDPVESGITNAIRRGRGRTPNDKFGAYHFTIKLLSLLAVA